MKRWQSYLPFSALIVLLAGLVVMGSAALIGDAVSDYWQNFPQSSAARTVTVTQTTARTKPQVTQALLQAASAGTVIVAHYQATTASNYQQYIGVAGHFTAALRQHKLLGRTPVSATALNRVQSQANGEKTLGNGLGTVNQLRHCRKCAWLIA